jgi:hypothetical protein
MKSGHSWTWNLDGFRACYLWKKALEQLHMEAGLNSGLVWGFHNILEQGRSDPLPIEVAKGYLGTTWIQFGCGKHYPVFGPTIVHAGTDGHLVFASYDMDLTSEGP